MSSLEALDQFEEMNEVGKDIEALETQQEEEESVSHLTPHMLALAVQPVSRMLARKTGIKAFELTDEDVRDLERALEPLNLSMLEKISKYLPLIIFSIGYVSRIFMEWYDKEKEKKKKKREKEEETEKKKLVYIPKEEDTIQEVYVVPPLPKREELNPQNPTQGAEVKEEKKTDESPKSDKAGT